MEKHRIIKFRQWNDKKKEFQFIGFSHEGSMCTSEGFEQSCRNRLDQYTGFKDKNKVEVYEGDIINVAVRVEVDNRQDCSYIEADKQGNRTYICCKPKPCVVGFVAGQFILKHKSGKVITIFFIEELEVIGNIHQNPELLS